MPLTTDELDGAVLIGRFRLGPDHGIRESPNSMQIGMNISPRPGIGIGTPSLATSLTHTPGRASLANTVRVLTDTAAALDPAPEALHARLFTGPGDLASAWSEMVLHDVEQTSLTVRMEFTSFADCWEPEFGGQGTVGACAQSLSEEKQSLIEHHLRLAYLASGTDRPRSFAATARVCQGVR